MYATDGYVRISNLFSLFAGVQFLALLIGWFQPLLQRCTMNASLDHTLLVHGLHLTALCSIEGCDARISNAVHINSVHCIKSVDTGSITWQRTASHRTAWQYI